MSVFENFSDQLVFESLIQYILIPETQPTAIIRQMKNFTPHNAYALQVQNKFLPNYSS